MSDIPTPNSKKTPLNPGWFHALIRLYRQGYDSWPSAIAYLLLFTLAEILTVLVDPRIGVLLNWLLLFLLLLQAARQWRTPNGRFVLSLIFIPLIRIISLSLPLAGYPLPLWYLLTAIPLFVAALVVLRQFDLPRRTLGRGCRYGLLQLPIAATGLPLGLLTYYILKPEPLVDTFTLQQFCLPALILLLCTGYLEELIFRHIMQDTAVAQLGPPLGILYVALLAAILHIGFLSALNFAYVLLVGLYFGLAAHVTKSIVGVTLAHGLVNISLFLIFPFLLG